MSNTTSLVNSLASTVSSFESNVNTEVTRVDNVAKEMQVTVEKVYKRVMDFKETIKKGEEKQLAHENVISKEQEINELLKNYQAVRRVVLGVIKDFDINLVRNKTINELSEELWLGSSRYWLSYSLIAISAWILGDKELAENAINISMRENVERTSLFFCLFNMRFERHIAAKQWLTIYFDNVNPCETSKEVAVLLQAYLAGAFGTDNAMEYIVRERINHWETELATNNSIAEDLKDGFFNFISATAGDKEFSGDFLIDHCNNYENIKKIFKDASTFDVIYDDIMEIKNAPTLDEAENYRQLIDSLLDDLVNQPDKEEQRLLNEQMYYKFVMEAEGDVKKAEEKYKAYLKTEEYDHNIGLTMLKWVLYSNQNEASGDVKKFALYQTKKWYREGVEKYNSLILTRRPGYFDIQIDDWTDSVDGKDHESAEHSLVESINSNKLAKVVFNNLNIIFSVICILSAIIGIATIVSNKNVGLVFFGISAVLLIVVGVSILIGFSSYPSKIQHAKDILDGCYHDIEIYNGQFDEMLNKEKELESLLYGFEY